MTLEAQMPDKLKLLVDDDEASKLLSIPITDLDWLASTQQLSPIHIRGRRLFMVAQLEELVQTYKSVQSRGQQ
jgi:hypothetical protein